LRPCLPFELPNELPASARQDLCRRYVESAEAWLRRLVHAELLDRSGAHYITAGPWRKEVTEHVAGQLRNNPGKFAREIDATTFEQLIYVVCHPGFAPSLKLGLNGAYPDGVDEARTFLDRIRAIRNDVSHGRQCSARQLEQAICYSNDIADSIKDYFRSKNLSKEFNVPTLVEFNDNVGNSEKIGPGAFFRGIDLTGPSRRRLYPGDVLVAEVVVDPSFDPDCYHVEWWLKTNAGAVGSGLRAQIEITNRHVGERMELQFKVKSASDWHRDSSGYDEIIDFIYRVLPHPT
jgi:hypothetical protein